MLFSPVVDAAPGKSKEEKHKAFSEGQKKGISEQRDHFTTNNPLDTQRFEDSNPLGELYSMWMITQLDGRVPLHRGRKYIPTLMGIGTNDPLTFTGFPIALFREYYDQLENMDTHYFDRLPLLRRTKNYEKVGHWLGEYMDPESGMPIQIALARHFIEQQLGVSLYKTDKHTNSSIPASIDVLGNFANNLAFRQFLDQYRFSKAHLNPDLQSLGRKANERMREGMSQILQKYDIAKNLHKKILGKIFSSPNFEQLKEFLDSQTLPNELLKEIADYITATRYFKIKQIVKGVYSPTKNDLLERGFISSEHQERAESLLTELSTGAMERIRLAQELSILEKREKNLKRQYQTVRKSVQAAFDIITKALKEAPEQPPSSLASELTTLRDELEVVRTLAERVIGLFEGLSVRWVAPYSVAQMDNLVKEHETEINHFRQLYHQYDHHRQDLKRKLVQAIGKGEMGQEYQQAVLDIYGQNLDGQGSVYSKLEDINRELAQVEIDTYNKNTLYVKSLMKYQDILEQLLPLLQPVKEGNEDWIDLARNGYTFSNVSIHDILKPIDSNRTLEPDEYRRINQGINNEYEPFFSEALNTWQQLRSNSLPDLPIDL